MSRSGKPFFTQALWELLEYLGDDRAFQIRACKALEAMSLALWARDRAQQFFAHFRNSNLETKVALASPDAWFADLFGASPAASSARLRTMALTIDDV